MLQEQVDPASWQICQEVNRIKKQNATLLTEIQKWGAALTRVGNALSRHPDTIAQLDFAGLPSFRELHQAIHEIMDLQSRLNSLIGLAKKMNMHDLCK